MDGSFKYSSGQQLFLMARVLLSFVFLVGYLYMYVVVRKCFCGWIIS